MAVEDEKLERFKHIIFSEVEAKCADILNEAEAYKKQKIQEAADDELEKSYRLIQKRVDEFRSEFSREMTREKYLSRQRLFQFRQELIDGLFREAEERLTQFSDSSEYESWLKKTLDRESEKLDGAVLLVREQDRPLFEKLLPGQPLETDPRNRIGGFGILNRKLHIFADETFASRLEDAKEKFYQNGSLGLDVVEDI